jgi:hypothetical protein
LRRGQREICERQKNRDALLAAEQAKDAEIDGEWTLGRSLSPSPGRELTAASL